MKKSIAVGLVLMFAGSVSAGVIENMKGSSQLIPMTPGMFTKKIPAVPVPAPAADNAAVPALSPEVKALSDASITLLTDEMSISMGLAMIGPFLQYGIEMDEIKQEMAATLANAKKVTAGLDKIAPMLEKAAAMIPEKVNSRGITGAVIMLESAPGYLEMAIEEMNKIKSGVKKLPDTLKAVDAEINVIKARQEALKPLMETAKKIHAAAAGN